MGRELDYNLIGQNIRKRRKQRKFTQAKLAELVGCSVANITNIENANTKLSLQMLRNVAFVLNAGIDELLGVEPICEEPQEETAAKELRAIWDELPYESSELCKRACVDFCRVFAQHLPKQ